MSTVHFMAVVSDVMRKGALERHYQATFIVFLMVAEVVARNQDVQVALLLAISDVEVMEVAISAKKWGVPMRQSAMASVESMEEDADVKLLDVLQLHLPIFNTASSTEVETDVTLQDVKLEHVLDIDIARFMEEDGDV